MAKLDPMLKEMFFVRSVLRPLPLEKAAFRDDSIHVFIRCTDSAALQKAGFPIHFISSREGTAILSLSQIKTLIQMPEVDWMEAGSSCKPALDVSVPQIRANDLWQWNGGAGYTGKGVVVGIVDSGIDWSHADFIASDGKTSRILYLWDQSDNTIPHPNGFGYGTLYTKQQIDNELDGSPAGVVREKDVDGHGTHVAGIAAGNGLATGRGKTSGRYKGVAPEADLIIVKLKSNLNTEIVDGMDFIFKQARELNRPAVVNLSLGQQIGPHDGTSQFERSLDDLFVNDGKGQAIVVAAGNDRNKAVHFQKVFSSGVQNSATVNFTIDNNKIGAQDQVVFDVWYSNAGLSVTVVTPSGVSKGPIATGNPLQEWYTSEGRIYVDNSMDKADVYNGDRRIRIYLTDSNASTDNLVTGTWKLVFSGKTGKFDGWLYGSTDEPIAKVASEIDTSTLVTEPGNSKRVVTVSAYVSRNSWPSLQSDQTTDYRLVKGTICDFSSPGPPRSNSLHTNSMNKPDIAAPGQYVLSALSGQIEAMPQDPWIASDGKHQVMSGTSMAAPHLTGLVALLFQANPNADVSDIRKILIDASPGIRLGTGWNKSFGYGIVDAYETMKKLTPVEVASDRVPSKCSLYQNYPNPFNGSTAIEFSVPPVHRGDASVDLSILDLNGKILRSFSLGASAESRFRLLWDGREQSGTVAPSGVYIYRLTYGLEMLSRKMIFIR